MDNKLQSLQLKLKSRIWTLIVTLMFAFMAKSKELRVVGKASSIPVLFGVNEPILFGAPLILMQSTFQQYF